MAAPRSGPRSRFTVMVLVMVCLTLITVDSKANGGGVLGSLRSGARDLLVPAQEALDGVAAPVADFADGLVNSGDLKAENRRLREENERLQGQLLIAADLQRQLTALQDGLGLDVVKDIPQVAARVTNTAPSNVQLTVEIDRGSDHGIARDMPVVTGAGLVGRVESVSGRRSVVRLVADPDVGVGVKLGTTATKGFSQGRGAGEPLAVGGVSPDDPIVVGEAVLTSGGEGRRYPPDLPVGRVSSAEVVPGVAFQRVAVEPAVDLDRLEYVAVLLWRP